MLLFCSLLKDKFDREITTRSHKYSFTQYYPTYCTIIIISNLIISIIITMAHLFKAANLRYGNLSGKTMDLKVVALLWRCNSIVN